MTRSPQTGSQNNSFSSDGSSPGSKHRISKTPRGQFLKRYEQLKDKIVSAAPEAQKGEAFGLVHQYSHELDEIYRVLNSEKNRDTRVHLKDAETLHDFSHLAATNAKNLKYEDVGIALTQKDFVKNLKIYMNPNEVNGTSYDDDEDAEESAGTAGHADTFNSYNWLKLGALYFSQSNRAVSSDFLYGPLATERKRFGPRQKNVDDTKSGSLTTAKSIRASDLNSNSEKSTSDMVRSVYKTFSQQAGESEYNFFKFFINPHSFSQSVENLFFTSFLIRDGKLKLYKDQNGIPMVKRTTQREAEEASVDSSNKSHHIATFDQPTWESLVKTFNITESFIEHRDISADQFSSDEDEGSESDSSQVIKPEDASDSEADSETGTESVSNSEIKSGSDSSSESGNESS